MLCNDGLRPQTGKKYPVPGQWKKFYFVLKFDEHKLLYYEQENVSLLMCISPSPPHGGTGYHGELKGNFDLMHRSAINRSVTLAWLIKVANEGVSILHLTLYQRK